MNKSISESAAELTVFTIGIGVAVSLAFSAFFGGRTARPSEVNQFEHGSVGS